MNYLFSFINWNNETRKRKVCVFMAAEFKRKKLAKQKKSRGKTFRKDISQQGTNKITNKGR